jgi:cupin 2 domain-containing protein
MLKQKLINLFDIEGWSRDTELFTPIYEQPGFRIERILTAGQTSPALGWYNQDENEMVILLQGNAVIEFDDNTKAEMKTGDMLVIEKFRKHKVSYTSTEPPCVWLAAFWRD